MNMFNNKFCVNCKNLNRTLDNSGVGVCIRNTNEIDLVTGFKKVNIYMCSEERAEEGKPTDKCGVIGRYYEPQFKT